MNQRFNWLLLSLVIIVSILCIYLYFRIQDSSLNTVDKQIKKINDKVQIIAKIDTSLVYKIKELRDSVKLHKKSADYWRLKYKEPLQLTVQEVKQVFSEDSLTIVKQVLKGIECDSLQKNQASVISSQDKEIKMLDNLSVERDSTIQLLVKKDSLRADETKGLKKKVRKGRLAQIALLVLLIVSLQHR